MEKKQQKRNKAIADEQNYDLKTNIFLIQFLKENQAP